MTRIINRIETHFRTDRIHRQNDQRAASLKRFVEKFAAEDPQKAPVVFFNASTRLGGVSLNAAFSFLTSLAVRCTGTPVNYFVCQAGMTRCMLGTKRLEIQANPPCRTCTRQSRALYGPAAECFDFQADARLSQMIRKCSVDELARVEHEGMPLGALALPSMRWILRCHNLADDQPTRFLYRQYILSAWNLAQNFEHFVERLHPQALVLFNGTFFPEAAARWVAEKHGIFTVTHEVGLLPYTVYFTTGQATAYPIDIPADFELSPEQNQRLDDYLAQRFQGNFSMAGVRFWPSMQGLSAEFLEKAKTFRQIVPVFTNVIFDTSQAHANTLFPHMFAWLDLVHALAKEHPDTLFVLRAHPDELRPGKAAIEDVGGWAKESGIAQLPNVVFVGSREFISSYELIQRSKFVMVYNSTIGLEATLMGAPVLCGGKARFTQLPTVFFPESAEAYRKQAEAFLKADSVSTPEAFKANARRFLYYQLYKTSLPMGDLIEEDGVWKGYVRFKDGVEEQLKPGVHPSLSILVEGLLNQKPFLLDN